MRTVGFILVVVGMMVVAGSANDCDGKCMAQANDTMTMLMVAGCGLFATLLGALAIFSTRD
jgi:hypothetical protein|tara:strand:+ start:713 stop:895 length:183 start_codon:yes stop_codon:yes gene_type:complete